MEELRDLEFLEEGDIVDIPDVENDDLIEENSLSVVVRCLNPTVHKVGGLVKALPPIWGLEDRTHERGVGENRAQFIFQSDRDLHHVLTRGPWFVNGWIVALEQWTPSPGPEYLTRILFWIRIRGLPVHLLNKQTVDYLLGPLGKVEKVELHAKNSTSVEYIRAQVWISTEEPLQFRRTARFKSVEVVPTELEYEKLLKVCFLCKRLTHDQTHCQFAEPVENVPQLESSRRFNENRRLQNRGPQGDLPMKNAKGKMSKGKQVENRSRSISNHSESRFGKGKESREQYEMDLPEATCKVWRPKSTRANTSSGTGGSKQTRSTEESNFKQNRGESPGGGRKSGGSSGASHMTPTVFERLGGHRLEEDKETTKSGGSGGSRTPLLKGGDQDDKGSKGESSNGSRGSGSVFERLGITTVIPQEIDKKKEETQPSKRRRLSRSDERSSKKVKLASRIEEKSPSSVFQRLGGQSCEKNHSAPVAAIVPSHSVRGIVLTSGSNLKEGLMFDSNPSNTP